LFLGIRVPSGKKPPDMRVKVYAYQGCDTCRKALKYLDASGVKYRTVPIRECPPRPAELKKMLKACGGELRKLFNTSGQDYRKLKLKEKLPRMSEAGALQLLAGNGNLVRRPFALRGRVGRVGFDEATWSEFLK
jgi:arsenate reductase